MLLNSNGDTTTAMTVGSHASTQNKYASKRNLRQFTKIWKTIVTTSQRFALCFCGFVTKIKSNNDIQTIWNVGMFKRFFFAEWVKASRHKHKKNKMKKTHTFYVSLRTKLSYYTLLEPVRAMQILRSSQTNTAKKKIGVTFVAVVTMHKWTRFDWKWPVKSYALIHLCLLHLIIIKMQSVSLHISFCFAWIHILYYKFAVEFIFLECIFEIKLHQNYDKALDNSIRIHIKKSSFTSKMPAVKMKLCKYENVFFSLGSFSRFSVKIIHVALPRQKIFKYSIRFTSCLLSKW